MRKGISLLLAVGLLLQGMLLTTAFAAEEHFAPAPQTEYARAFIAKAEDQQWLLDRVEQLLVQNQRSINTLNSADDLAIITTLGFANEGVSGHIPAAIGELKALRHLYLTGNQLAGTIPTSLYALPDLETIDLSFNLYSGAIPSEFGGMAALRSLNLRGNAYTGSIPASFLTNTAIAFLDLSANKLTGALPAGLNGMTGLTYLSVSENHWGGALPDLSTLVELNTLSAWGCGLTGPLPDSLYSLSKLRILDLAGNSLTGGISDDLGNLTQLRLLAFGNNELTGTIPATLSALTKLTDLDLSNNLLEGKIPDAFAGMTKLQNIHIEENKLWGLIPGSLEVCLDDGVKLYTKNNYLTGAALKKAVEYEKNFCDGANNEQYRLTGPTELTIGEITAISVFPQLYNRSLTTGDTRLKPMLPIACYSTTIENDPSGKVALVSDGTVITVKAAPLPDPIPDPDNPDAPLPTRPPQEIKRSENVRLVITLTDNTGSEYSKVSILLTTEVQSSGGGGGGTGTTISKTEAHKPYIDGYPDGRFGPADPLTREQAAKLVVTALGGEAQESAYSKYIDVAAKRWSAPYIEYARKQGYLLGIGGSAFGPELVMTRAEFATCLARVWGTADYDASVAKEFPDVKRGTWYYDAVMKASALGLVNGMPDGGFHPLEPVSRAEAVTIINRLLGRNPETAPELKTEKMSFTDVADNHWARLDILEASIKHQHPASR